MAAEPAALELAMCYFKAHKLARHHLNCRHAPMAWRPILLTCVAALTFPPSFLHSQQTPNNRASNQHVHCMPVQHLSTLPSMPMHVRLHGITYVYVRTQERQACTM
jgi:hypothetical protein